jgi:hypothetical protein
MSLLLSFVLFAARYFGWAGIPRSNRNIKEAYNESTYIEPDNVGGRPRYRVVGGNEFMD